MPYLAIRGYAKKKQSHKLLLMCVCVFPATLYALPAFGVHYHWIILYYYGGYKILLLSLSTNAVTQNTFLSIKRSFNSMVLA